MDIMSQDIPKMEKLFSIAHKMQVNEASKLVLKEIVDLFYRS